MIESHDGKPYIKKINSFTLDSIAKKLPLLLDKKFGTCLVGGANVLSEPSKVEIICMEYIKIFFSSFLAFFFALLSNRIIGWFNNRKEQANQKRNFLNEISFNIDGFQQTIEAVKNYRTALISKIDINHNYDCTIVYSNAIYKKLIMEFF